MAAEKSRRISTFDRRIAERIRAERQKRGITQQQLARALGRSFQQIQKYERGTNRVSAGNLFVIARLFELSVTAFFESLGEDAPAEPQPSAPAELSRDALEFVRLYREIEDDLVRERIRILVKHLGDDEEY